MTLLINMILYIEKYRYHCLLLFVQLMHDPLMYLLKSVLTVNLAKM